MLCEKPAKITVHVVVDTSREIALEIEPKVKLRHDRVPTNEIRTGLVVGCKYEDRNTDEAQDSRISSEV
jgi:hypothetical protein